MTTVQWQRRSYSKVAEGIVYYISLDGGSKTMLVRIEAGAWRSVSDPDRVQFCKQDDGWFKVEDGAWFKLREIAWCEALDAMELDFEKHINDLVAAIE